MQPSTWSLVMLLSFALTACGPATVADVCFEFADTLCAKSASCGALGSQSVADCRSEDTALCCRSVDDCSRPPIQTGVEKIRKCEVAYRAMSCGQVNGGLTPAECQFN